MWREGIFSSKLSNKSRDARTEEPKYLRKTMVELEARFSVLKINGKTKKSKTLSSPPNLFKQAAALTQSQPGMPRELDQLAVCAHSY